MSIVAWDDSFSVGVPEIDEQYRKLFGMINILDRIISSGHGMDVLGRLFSGLITYADSNFRAEELYMWNTGFPDGASHKHEHDEMIARAHDLSRKLESGQREIAVEMLEFLQEELRCHILGTSIQYTHCLSQAAQAVGA